MKRLLGFLFAALLALPALAHKSSDAYLQLTSTDAGLALRLDVALRDLDIAIELDANGDNRLTWGEVKAALPAIERYALDQLQVAGCPLQITGTGLERRNDGAYAVLYLTSPCKPAVSPAIRYELLRDVDATHRGILRIDWGGAPTRVEVLDPAHALVLATAAAASSPVASEAAPTDRLQFLKEGVHHILTGYDHVLFLLCLLLPSVMRRTPAGWQPVERLSQAVLPVAAIVTAFTLAHSITLGLAAMEWVSLPPAFIEPAIAVTIALAALDNLWPIFRGRRALVTFAFGLIHGFGFAGVLAELNLPAAQFAWALLQFNLGIEAGQLIIVMVAIATLYLVRRRDGYSAWIIRGGSYAAMLVAVLWFVERTADVKLLPL